MQKHLSTIVLPLAAGLGFIAFNDPAFYKQIYPYIQGAVAAVYLLTQIWGLSVTVVSSRIQQALGYDRADEIRKAVKAIEPPFLPLFIGGIVAWSYLIFLGAWADNRMERESPPRDTPVTQSPE